MKIPPILTFVFLLIAMTVSGQSVIGKWKTIDDTSGDPKSIVEVFERDGKVWGRIVKLFRKAGEDPDPVCTECDEDDPRYNRKIIGMEILESMEKDGDEYEGGQILDPNNGKIYRCKIWVESGSLKVRGYLGPFYRTQTWAKYDL